MSEDVIELKSGDECEFPLYDKYNYKWFMCKLRPMNKDGVIFEFEIESDKDVN